MLGNKKYEYGIIYDMDNTVLASKIDFALMKLTVSNYVAGKAGDFDFKPMSVGQVIEYGASHGLDQGEVEMLWSVVGDIEEVGMINAKPEPGAAEALADLQDNFLQLVLTNNAAKAAKLALETAGLTPYFAQTWAREDIGSLKPDPQGVEVIKAQYPQIGKWLLVGDSWLDGVAAKKAGVGFCAYGNWSLDYWQQHGVTPDLAVATWQPDAVFCIQQWFGQ